MGIGLDDPAPNLTAEIALGCLPLLTPADAPEPAFTEPQGQPVLMDRAQQVAWRAGAAKARAEGFPAVAVVGLDAGQSLGNLYGDAARKAGIDARLHGLRKAFCVYWAEQGMTVHQIAAMAGHTSLAEVERYTKAADRKRIVRAIAEGA